MTSDTVAPSIPPEPTAEAQSHLTALLHYTGGFYSAAMTHGMPAGETANAVAHVERAARRLAALAVAGSAAPEPAKLIQQFEDAHMSAVRGDWNERHDHTAEVNGTIARQAALDKARAALLAALVGSAAPAPATEPNPLFAAAMLAHEAMYAEGWFTRREEHISTAYETLMFALAKTPGFSGFKDQSAPATETRFVPGVETLLVWAVEDGVIRMSKVMDADLQDALVKFAARFAKENSNVR